jgi:hypothetical protein
VGFGEGEGFGVRDRAGDGEAEEAGEADEFGVGEGEALCLGDRVGFSDGAGEDSWRGFTGPVGFKGVPGVGFAGADGVGVGVAAKRSEAPEQSSSVRMERRNLMGAEERQA